MQTLIAFSLAVYSISTFAAPETFEYPQGKNPIQKFQSPNGLIEECMTITKIPGAQYSAADLASEQNYCSIDLYDPQMALCPKTWSTSPGTMIYSVGATGLTPAQYEATKCGTKEGHVRVAKFKQTMNAKGTSGTYSTSSTLYYHFSRYFDSSVSVPVAVLRTIDKEAHLERVTSKAAGMGVMNRAGWAVMKAAQRNPASYVPADDLFTADRKQIYGTLVGDSGERYGAEFNGTRKSGWGDGQNNDFQKTPGFMALRSEKPLDEAITEGLKLSSADPLIRQALGSAEVPRVQMLLWMKELTEIVILDYMFNQQDRVGNIDYVWKWYYRDANGAIQSQKEKLAKDLPRNRMSAIQPPPALAASKPVLLQRTYISDNDAGGRVQYTNFTKRTKMLEKIRHISPATYRQLIRLSADFKKQGPVYRHTESMFGITPREFASVVANVSAAATILNQTCKAGKLQFDLIESEFFEKTIKPQSVNCDTP